MDTLDGEGEACVYFYLNMKLAPESEWRNQYGFFHLDSLSVDNGRIELSLTNESTETSSLFRILENNEIDKGINLFITKVTPKGTKNEIFNITSSFLPRRMIRDAYTWIDEKMTAVDDEVLIEKTKAIRMYAMLLSRSGRGEMMDPRLVENLGEALRLARALVCTKSRINYVARLDTIIDLIHFILEYGREGEKKTVDSVIALSISKMAMLVEREGLTDETMELIVKAVGAIRYIGKEPDLGELQDAVYQYYISGSDKGENERKVFSTLNFH